ncbi:MAG TPA: HDIG domain-containing protein [Thermodesulfobacteriota bacterium]|nr:HDIG domain-containing protein [Thermodesulfobacteriota bacterium]
MLKTSMDKSEKETKKKPPRISRLGETPKLSTKDNLARLIKTLFPHLREKFFLLFFLCLFITLANTPSLFFPSAHYKVGEIAQSDIKASQDVLVEDQVLTDQKRQEIAAQTPTVYDFDEQIGLGLEERIRQGFLAMRDDMKKAASLEGEKGKLEKIWGITLTPQEFEALKKDRFSEISENGLIQLIQSVMTLGIVNNKLMLMNESSRGVIVRKLSSKQEFLIRGVERFPDLDEARDRIERRSVYLLVGKDRTWRPIAVDLAQKLIVPNLYMDRTETERRIQKAIQEIRPSLYQVKKGDIIAREGERITEGQLYRIELGSRSDKGRALVSSAGLALLWGLFLYMMYQSALRGGLILSKELRDLIFLTALLAITFICLRLADFLAQVSAGGSSRISPYSVLLAIPVGAAPMMTSLVLGPLAALLFSLVQGFLAAVFWQGNPELALYFAVAGLWSSLSCQTCHTRWDLIRMGLFLGLINLASVLAIQMINGKLLFWETPLNLSFGFVGGILSAIVVTGVSPLIERIFGYTTDMKLLERANMDQPLLRELMVQAPGTYHHSIIVGNMVEAAAEAIRANSLLARVSAYYHDIGKIRKPLYFIENQMGGENKHEKLAPSMSSLILIAHVKDGVEMAHLHKLEEPIIDIINQHHGTGLISFFYQKALELKGGDAGQVSAEDFRYPGPKPQTREAGLVLLADAIEASSRTLVDPTPARIQGLVQKIINNVFADGQLDECNLTLKDLTLISASFIKILNGIFHHRIEYPEAQPKLTSLRRKTNGDTDKQPTETDRPGKDSENQSSVI